MLCKHVHTAEFIVTTLDQREKNIKIRILKNLYPVLSTDRMLELLSSIQCKMFEILFKKATISIKCLHLICELLITKKARTIKSSYKQKFKIFKLELLKNENKPISSQ